MALLFRKTDNAEDSFRREKEVLLAELNKAHSQITSLENIVFELDGKLKESKLQLGISRSTVSDNHDILQDCSKEMCKIVALSDEFQAPSSSMTFMGDIDQSRHSIIEAETLRLKLGQMLDENNELVKTNGALQNHLAELQNLLCKKDTELQELVKALAHSEENVRNLGEHDDKFKKRINRHAQNEQWLTELSEDEKDAPTAEVKLNLVSQKVEQDRQQFNNEQTVMKQALEHMIKKNHILNDEFVHLKEEKDQIEELFFASLKDRKEAQQQLWQLEKELRQLQLIITTEALVENAALGGETGDRGESTACSTASIASDVRTDDKPSSTAAVMSDTSSCHPTLQFEHHLAKPEKRSRKFRLWKSKPKKPVHQSTGKLPKHRCLFAK